MQKLTQIASALFGLVLFAAALIFTSLILAVAAVGALVLWGWIMWRSRHARRTGRATERSEKLVIEGEYVVDRDEGEPQGKDAKGPRP